MLVSVLLLTASATQGLDVPDTPSIYNFNSWVPVKNEHLEPLPLPPVSSSWQDPNAEIFVGVSHYRDSRCTDTLNNIFKKAKFPDRIKVGKWFEFDVFSFDLFNRNSSTDPHRKG